MEIIRHIQRVGRRVREENDVMLGESALAYGTADYRAIHNLLASALEEEFGTELAGTLVDLGSGPGDITARLVEMYPLIKALGIDASPEMLNMAVAHRAGCHPRVAQRLRFAYGHMPFETPPEERADIVTSINTAHHLKAGEIWKAIKQWAKLGAPICVVDLYRSAATLEEASDYVEKELPIDGSLAAEECTRSLHDRSKSDFSHSIRAAFTPQEVRAQLVAAGLGYLQVQKLGERHMVIAGRFLGEIHDGAQRYPAGACMTRSCCNATNLVRLSDFDFPKGWEPWNPSGIAMSGLEQSITAEGMQGSDLPPTPSSQDQGD